MKKAETIRLIALAKRLEKYAESEFKAARRLYEKSSTGNNDEDWQKVSRMQGFSNGMMESAAEIRHLVNKLNRSKTPEEGG